MLIGEKARAGFGTASPCFICPVLGDVVKLLWGPELSPGLVLTLTVTKVPQLVLLACAAAKIHGAPSATAFNDF